jgi:hypothetical protein
VRALSGHLFLCLAVGWVLAGCGGDDGDGPAAQVTPPREERPATTPAAATPTPTPTPAPTAPKPRFFADVASFWSTPFSAYGRSVPLRPDNAALRRELVRLRGHGTAVEQRIWTIPTYVVRSDRTLIGPDGEVVERDLPMRRLRVGGAMTDPRKLDDPRVDAGERRAILNFLLQRGIDGEGWPLPRWAKGDPSGSGDGHLAVYVEDTGQYAELYNAEHASDEELRGTAGGYVHDLRTHDGRYEDNFVRSLEWSSRFWGPVAASVPTAGGLIWESEIRTAYAAWRRGDHENAVIPHMLGVNIHAHTKNTWVWPANRTDWTEEYGKGGNPLQEGPIEMGQIIKFPDALNLRAYKGRSKRETALLQILIRTGQRHGFVVWDQSGGGFMLRAEQVWTRRGLSKRMFDYGNTKRWMQSLPFEKALFVETRNNRRAFYRP